MHKDMKHPHYGSLNLSFPKYLAVAVLSALASMSVNRFSKAFRSIDALLIIPVVNTYGDSIHQFHQGKLFAKQKRIKVHAIVINEPPAVEVAKVIMDVEELTFYREPIFDLIRKIIPSGKRRSSIDHLVYYHLRKIFYTDAFSFYEENTLPWHEIDLNKNQRIEGDKGDPTHNPYFSEFLTRKPYYFVEFIKYSELLTATDDYAMRKLDVPIQELKKSLGLKRPYICIHVKEQLASVNLAQPRAVGNVGAYKRMLSHLIAAGYEIVALGKNRETIVELEKLGVNPYGVSEYQSIANDFNLVAGCEFYIGNNSGPYALALAFRKPMLMINFVGLGEATVANPLALYLIKRVFDILSGKILTISEYLMSQAFYYHSSEYFGAANARYRLIDNTEREIFDSCVEFQERLQVFKYSGTHAHLDTKEQLEIAKELNITQGCMYFSRPVLAAANFQISLAECREL